MYHASAPDGQHPYQRIANRLRLEIEAGKYEPDTALPSTRELEDIFGVAKMTVRAAVAVLRHEGLVYSKHGKGVYVSPLDTPAAPDVTPPSSGHPDIDAVDEFTGDLVISRLDGLNQQMQDGFGVVLERLDALEQRMSE